MHSKNENKSCSCDCQAVKMILPFQCLSLGTNKRLGYIIHMSNRKTKMDGRSFDWRGVSNVYYRDPLLGWPRSR